MTRVVITDKKLGKGGKGQVWLSYTENPLRYLAVKRTKLNNLK